jgi:hypothetical protein
MGGRGDLAVIVPPFAIKLYSRIAMWFSGEPGAGEGLRKKGAPVGPVIETML